jgi:hypothetical protein
MREGAGFRPAPFSNLGFLLWGVLVRIRLAGQLRRVAVETAPGAKVALHPYRPLGEDIEDPRLFLYRSFHDE